MIKEGKLYFQILNVMYTLAHENLTQKDTYEERKTDQRRSLSFFGVFCSSGWQYRI